MTKLASVFDVWNGYQTSLLHTVASSTSEQLQWRPAPDRPSAGELIRHLSLGRMSQTLGEWTSWRTTSITADNWRCLQGIEAFELRTLGGHIISPPLAKD